MVVAGRQLLYTTIQITISYLTLPRLKYHEINVIVINDWMIHLFSLFHDRFNGFRNLVSARLCGKLQTNEGF